MKPKFEFNTDIHSNRLRFWLFSFLTCLSSQLYASHNHIEVLAVHSYNQEYSWTESQYTAFKETLSKALPDHILSFSSEYLDTKRIKPSANYKRELLHFLKFKHKLHPPQLIYATDDNALRFLNSDIPLWNTPIVFSGINDKNQLNAFKHQKVTGVIEEKDIAASLALAREILPRARQVIFLGDNGATDQAIRKDIKRLAKQSDLKITHLSNNKLESLINKLKETDPGVIILTTIGGLHDENDQLIRLKKSIKTLTRTGRIILVMEDGYLFPGVVGGYVTSGRLQGKNAALIASRILSGESASEIKPVNKNLSQLIFNWPDLVRHHIQLDNNTLSDAILIDQPEPFYKEYPNTIKWLIGFLIFSVLIIIGFTINSRQKTHLLREQTTDLLTGLPNRIKLLQDITKRQNSSLAIIDINNFKVINDMYGFEVGDKLLQTLSQHLDELRNELCNIYRTGGDQFAILSGENMQANEFDEKITHLLRQSKDSSYHINDLDITLTLTAGISRYKNEFILPKAEKALDHAKRNNIGSYIIDKSSEKNSRYQENIIWAHKLSKALKEERVIAFYQPIIDNKSGKISKHEALVRLIDEDHSIISPYFFLEAAKNTRQYAKLTRAMIEHAFTSIQNTGCPISINFTVDDIRNEKTINFLKEKLNEYQVADKLVIELTESEGIENYNEVSEFINEIKQLGCQVAIDDFGTGYSNFTHLMHLNVDFLKIDGSIIKNILTDKNAEIVTQTLVDFSRRLGIKTIAEFVDSEELQSKVKELGIDFSQGYFLGKPSPDIQ